MGSHHVWNFFCAGGFDQVHLASGADLLALDELDQKLWVALACPTTGLEFDEKTLKLIDSDKDGRIRAPELIAAVKWIGACLKNPDDLLKGTAEVPLSGFNASTPEGRQLLASAKQILANLGKADATAITLEDTLDTKKIFVNTHFNGDGILPADSAEDPATQAVISEIIDCLGAETDKSEKPGVNQEKVDQFFAAAQTYSDWWAKAESDPAILPLGAATESAAAAFSAVKAKVDDYFTRCRLAAFDSRAANTLNPEEKDYLSFTAKELKADAAEIALFPLAQVGAGKPLPLGEGLNPAWSGPMATLVSEVVQPLFPDKTALADADWATITTTFVPYQAWLAAKAGAEVEKLGPARVREILAGSHKETITALIAQDKSLEPEFSAIAEVERLLRYHRDLYKLTNNFVSFRDFYQRKTKAIFQTGTLYLDQRSCDLCLGVEDAGKHGIMAGLSGTYLAYCDLSRKGTGEKMQIVAAFTAGDSDNLMVGRNGIFYDRRGRDWDATITKLIENPISIRQAFWSPYKRAARAIQEQIAKRAAAADEAATARLISLEKAVAEGKAQELAAPKKIDPGMIAALGVGAAGVGGIVGGILTGFMNLGGWMPLGILAVILLISGPAMLLAWLKLRKRNLGPILDANGWAVNAKARINIPFGTSLTRIAVLPPGAQRDIADPYAEKKRPWGVYLVLLVVILLALGWALGKFDGALSSLSPKLTRSWVLHSVPPGGQEAASPDSKSPADSKQ